MCQCMLLQGKGIHSIPEADGRVATDTVGPVADRRRRDVRDRVRDDRAEDQEQLD